MCSEKNVILDNIIIKYDKVYFEVYFCVSVDIHINCSIIYFNVDELDGVEFYFFYRFLYFFPVYLFIYFLTLQYCIGFAIYQNESTTGIHVFPILDPPPSSLSIPSLWVFPVHQPQASSIMHPTWTGDSFYI